jgi:hypothetical protein
MGPSKHSGRCPCRCVPSDRHDERVAQRGKPRPDEGTRFQWNGERVPVTNTRRDAAPVEGFAVASGSWRPTAWHQQGGRSRHDRAFVQATYDVAVRVRRRLVRDQRWGRVATCSTAPHGYPDRPLRVARGQATSTDWTRSQQQIIERTSDGREMGNIQSR